MSYTRKDWDCGTLVTNEALNNIEEGVSEALACCDGGGAFIVRASSIEYADDLVILYADKTWQEIYDAFTAGTPCFFNYDPKAVCIYTHIEDNNGKFMFSIIAVTSDAPTRATSTNYYVRFIDDAGQISDILCGDPNDYPYAIAQCQLN